MKCPEKDIKFCKVDKKIILADECFEECRLAGRSCDGTVEANANTFPCNESDEEKEIWDKEDYKMHYAERE